MSSILTGGAITNFQETPMNIGTILGFFVIDPILSIIQYQRKDDHFMNTETSDNYIIRTIWIKRISISFIC